MLTIKQNEAKEEAANDLLKEQHPSMKSKKESNTRVTFGGTKKAKLLAIPIQRINQ